VGGGVLEFDPLLEFFLTNTPVPKRHDPSRNIKAGSERVIPLS